MTCLLLVFHRLLLFVLMLNNRDSTPTIPSVNDYWNNDEIYHYSPIAMTVSVNFTAISISWTIVQVAPPGSPGYNRLGKV